MNKIFTDEHCVKISWTGRGWATDMTKLKETTLIQIIQSKFNILMGFMGGNNIMKYNKYNYLQLNK